MKHNKIKTISLILAISFLCSLSSCKGERKLDNSDESGVSNSLTEESSSSNNLTEESSVSDLLSDNSNKDDKKIVVNTHSGYNKKLPNITPENYPKIGSTPYTLDFNHFTYSVLFEYANGDRIDEYTALQNQAFSKPDLINSLKKGTIDLALLDMSIRDSKDKKNFDNELKYQYIGSDRLVTYTSSKNSEKALTKTQLQDIFTGKINDWSEVGGQKGKIKLFGRYHDIQLVKNTIFDGQDDVNIIDVKESTDMIYNKMAELLCSYPPLVSEGTDYILAFDSYSTMLFSESVCFNYTGCNILKIDGNTPTIDSIINGKYPFTRKSYSVIKKTQSEKSIVRQMHNSFTDDTFEQIPMTSGLGINDDIKGFSIGGIKIYDIETKFYDANYEYDFGY